MGQKAETTKEGIQLDLDAFSVFIWEIKNT